MKLSSRLLATTTAICSLFAVTAQANDFLAEETARDDKVRGFIGFGAGMLPEHEGSEDYQAIPFIAGRVHHGHRYVELIGLGARANVINHENWQAGPALRFRFGRDSDVDNAQVARLDEVDDAFEAGAFVRYDFATSMMPRDSLGFEAQFLQDISDGHEGYEISLSTNYNAPVTQKLRLGADFGISYASVDYMESYYTVAGAESVRSGISTYDAEAGFKDVSLGLNVQYALTEKWGLFSRASYTRLMGDAGDSSIVEEQGDANQFLFGAGASYRF